MRPFSRGLDEAYPDVECALHHRSPWELLVATILSAQCTDVRVNIVTPELFRRFPTPAAMAKAKLPEIEELIRTTGFSTTRPNRFRARAAESAEDFGGKVRKHWPNSSRFQGRRARRRMVVRGVCFGKAEGVVVDTHVSASRIA